MPDFRIRQLFSQRLSCGRVAEDSGLVEQGTGNFELDIAMAAGYKIGWASRSEPGSWNVGLIEDNIDEYQFQQVLHANSTMLVKVENTETNERS